MTSLQEKHIMSIIKGEVDKLVLIYFDSCCAYDGLVDVGFRVNHGDNEFSNEH